MRVRIVKKLPPTLEGFNLSKYEENHIYEIGRSLSEVLILSGYAVPEENHARHSPSPGAPPEDGK
jgi:hypothetical protein